MQKIVSNDTKLDFSDVLIKPSLSNVNSREGINLLSNVKYFTQSIPVAASNVDGIGTFAMADILGRYGLITFLRKGYSHEQILSFYESKRGTSLFAIPSCGVGLMELELIHKLKKLNLFWPIIINVDAANGYTKNYRNIIKSLKEIHGDSLIIIAGNVCEAEGAYALFEAGATFVRVGIGNGSLCTTRIKTGIGYPQLSALMECVQVAEEHGNGSYIICDGGCQTPSDIAKAFVAGADIVMCAGMFAGHTEGLESGINELVWDQGAPGRYPEPKWIKTYGMSSNSAMSKYSGIKDYRTSEGREVNVPWKGSVESTVKDILGGLRSACTYTDCHNLIDLHEKGQFVKVNNQYNKLFC